MTVIRDQIEMLRPEKSSIRMNFENGPGEEGNWVGRSGTYTARIQLLILDIRFNMLLCYRGPKVVRSEKF